MKHLIILFLILIISLTAQEKIIKGRIVDADNLKPLAHANIIVENKSYGTASDENGEFVLQEIFQDNDILIISYIGFTTKKISVSTFGSGIQDIHLERSIIPSQTVLITATLGKQGITPITFASIKSEEIAKDYTVQDIPQFLGSLPSTTFYSENGNGIGYNYINIRGFDQRRISVSINGIPQNDPEDHNVYWLDFPDLLASTEMIQVQRGAGSGLSGYPAIGGSINIITSSFSGKPITDIGVSLGAYNTRKYSASFSSGLINDQYSVYVKLSKLLSSGYRNYSQVDFNSYHVSAVRFDKYLTTQINIFGGPISDGLAYTGLPKFAIKDRKLRRQNYSYWEASENSFDYTLERRPDEVENFSQPHYELLNEYRMSDNITINSALFMVLGTGFFDYDGSWSVYYDDYFRLNSSGFDTTVVSNALIRAQVENKQFGWIPRISLKHSGGELIIGSEIRRHRSLHWGGINYAENLPAGVTKDYRYYQYRGGKDIFNFFIHESYNLNDRMNILAEAQFAYHKYLLYEEKYVSTDFRVKNFFFNPRVGINYKLTSAQNIYLSLARVSREPRLKNYYDAAESSGGEVPQFERGDDGSYNFSKPLVKPETLYNVEFGSIANHSHYSASANLFLMFFNDEIIKEGQLDRFGQPITGNVKRTIHSGLELTANWRPLEGLEFIINGTYSRNYIDEGVTFIETDEERATATELDLSGNRISGFPDVIVNGILRYNNDGFYASITGRYVGQFYSDNYDEKLSEYLSLWPDFIDYSDNEVPAYFSADLMLSYELALNDYLKLIKISAQVNNIFDNLYAAYAIGKEFFPSAERNLLFGLSIGL